MFSNLVQIMLTFLIEATRITFDFFSGGVSLKNSFAQYMLSNGYYTQAINNRDSWRIFFWARGQHIKIT